MPFDYTIDFKITRTEIRKISKRHSILALNNQTQTFQIPYYYYYYERKRN
jgi:hypothetical protein